MHTQWRTALGNQEMIAADMAHQLGESVAHHLGESVCGLKGTNLSKLQAVGNEFPMKVF